jgi:hypothetical protein
MSGRRVVGGWVRASLVSVALSGLGGTWTAMSAHAAPLDVVFALDESSSLTASDFATQRTFTRDVVLGVSASLSYGFTGLAAGFVLHATNARIGITPTINQMSFLNQLDAVARGGGSSCPTCGIELAASVLATWGRLSAPDVIVLLSDGNNVRPGQLAAAADAARGAGNVILGIAVGATNDIDVDMRAIVSSPEFFFGVSAWSQLGGITGDVVAQLARLGAGSPAGPGPGTDPAPLPVPEPSALGLLAAACAGLIAFGRRRGRAWRHLSRRRAGTRPTAQTIPRSGYGSFATTRA